MPRKKNIQKHEALFSTSLNALGRKSYEDIRVEKICKTAGVGKNMFYRSYDSKQEWYDQIRGMQSGQCWEDLLSHYSGMQDGEFSEKMKQLSVYLMLYTRRNREFRMITRGQMEWRGKFAELIHSDTEEQKRFNRELDAYAAKMKMDPDDVRMNVYLLLSSAIRYGYETSEQTITVPFSTLKNHMTGISEQLFPE